LFAGYCAFVLAPIAARLSAGHAFGGDVSEYLLSARQTLHGNSGLDHYLFPVLPTLYLPLAASNLGYVTTYAVADVISGLLAIALFVAMGFLGHAVGRSAVAAAIAAGMVGTFFPVINEVGWGGQAQLLAFVLGVVAVGILVREKDRGWPLGSSLTAGLLLAAAVLTEAYAAAYFVAFALVWYAMVEGRHLLQPKTLRRYWPVPVLPLVAVGWVSASGGLAFAAAASDPILPHALTLGAWTTALSNIDFGNPVNTYCYAILIGALAAFAIFGTHWTRRTANAVAAATIACLVEVFLLTPGVYWDRAPYFVVFPLAVAAAAMSPGLPRAVYRRIHPDSRGAEAMRGRARRHRYVDTVCAIAVVGVVLAQSCVAVDLYPQVLRFYTVDSSSISELTWLRETDGGALLVAPEGQTFPVSYATGRPIFPWTQPIWFSDSAGQQAAILADMLVAGRQWIDAGPIKVVDSGTPSNTTSPAIFGYKYPYLVKLFDVTEGEGGTPERPALNSLRGAVPASTPGVRPEVVTFSDTDLLSTYNVSKVTSVASNGTISVNLTFRSTSVTIDPAYVGLQIPQAALRSFDIPSRSGQVVELFDQPGSIEVPFSTQIALSAPANLTVGDPVESGASGYPTIYWPISAGPGFVGQEMNVSLSLRIAGLTPSTPVLVSESGAMAENGIQWAILDAAAEPRIVPRFNLDPSFSSYWTGPTYVVYRVV
jgi:hypothetical protein